MKPSCDMTVDVPVAGSGYAWCMAAIAAHDAGSPVLILKRLPRFGGLSIRCAGRRELGRNGSDPVMRDERKTI